jgi:hypothetical protein
MENSLLGSGLMENAGKKVVSNGATEKSANAERRL